MSAHGPASSGAAPGRWIALDWGTSNVRAWLIEDGRVVERRRSSDGMGRLAPEDYEARFLGLCGDFLRDGAPVTALVCGMAGAATGWRDAGYVPVPCAPGLSRPVRAPMADPRAEVFIYPGLCQSTPPDVMRGEETLIAGFLSQAPAFSGVLCLPGTHSKWVEVQAGRVMSFRSFMTGELYALLAHHSVLRSCIDGAESDDSFEAGLRAGIGRPGLLSADLFALRAGFLLADGPAAPVGPKLSGLLIGAELAAMAPWDRPDPTVVIGDGDIAGLYLRACRLTAAPTTHVSAEDTALSGLRAAHDRFVRNSS
jgi:2-dehydro-3-deoxygalactonokinase